MTNLCNSVIIFFTLQQKNKEKKVKMVSLISDNPVIAKLAHVLEVMVSYKWKIVHLSDHHDLYNIP